MSIFTKVDFEMFAKGYLLKDILKVHVMNYDEVHQFYNAFVKDWNNSVDSRMSLLEDMNDSYVNQGKHQVFKIYVGHASLEVFLKKSIENIPQMPYRLDTAPEEDFKNTYPDCKEEVLDAIYEFYDKLSCNWAQLIDAWNTSIMSTNDRMHLEFPLSGIPGSNASLSFPKKYLIGEYDD